MRRSLLKPLVWQGIGLVFYLGGMLLFLFVAVNVFLSPPENSLENISVVHLAWIGVSIVLLVIGRTISWRLGGDRGVSWGFQGAMGRQQQDQSQLRELGYNVPAESDEDQQFAYEDGDVYVVCNQCGTRNEQGYSFCSNCSAELPE